MGQQWLHKKCWPFVCSDFYNLISTFYEWSIYTRSINVSFVTLIPKKETPTNVSDCRPISPLNCTIKIITKLLANTLQNKIMELIHLNQYGFIKARTIQDCLAWSFECLHMCHKSKKDLILLMLDFEKALDKVKHEFMLHVMKHKGLGDKWVSWMNAIFSSGTS